MDRQQQRARFSWLTRSAVLRLAFALVVPVVAIGAKAALDIAIVPTPWIVVTFVAVMLSSWLSGLAHGALSAGLILAVELAGIPFVDQEPAPLREATPGLEIITGVLAVMFGAAIRTTRVREQRSLRSMERISRESAETERRWRVLRDAATEFAEVGSVIQAGDILIRAVSELTGATADLLPARLAGSADEPPTAPVETADGVYVPIPGESGTLGLLRVQRSPGRSRHGEGKASVDDRSSGVGLGGGDLAATVALARLAGAAMDRIRLRTERGSARHRAIRSGERVDRLQGLTTALAAAVTAEAIGQAIVDHALDALGASVGLFYVVEPGGDLRLAHARGYPIGLAGHDARLHGDVALPAVDVARRGETVIVESPDAWRAAYPGTSDRLGITGTQSLVALAIGRPPIGVLVVQRPGTGTPGEDDLSFLDVIGHQATQALERARLYAHEREARQLQEAFVGVMSHELRTPITTILAGSKLLTRDSNLGERSRELASDIEAEADRLFRLIEDLLVLSRLERGNLAMIDEPVHLIRVLERVVGSESQRWPSTRFQLPDLPRGYLVRGDETYIEQVLRNLLANAAKYSPPESTVRIEIASSLTEVTVRVLDEGPGVTAAEVEDLFSLFYRSPTTAASAAGAGIGLFVCRRLVDAMGGHIWARARSSGGSEFGFALSVYPDDASDEEEGLDRNGDEVVTAGPLVASGEEPDRVSARET